MTNDGWFDGLTIKRAADQGGKLVDPSLLVIHYTAGASFQSDLAELTRADERPASAHFLVGRDGELAQLVAMNRVAYHAGKSHWKGRDNCNRFSIGIEVSNWGPLVQRGGKFYAWPGDFRRTMVPDSRVVLAKHPNSRCEYRAWEHYSGACLSTLFDLVVRVCLELPSIKEIVGHQDVSPGRKIDPGPALDLRLLRKAVEQARTPKEITPCDSCKTTESLPG